MKELCPIRRSQQPPASRAALARAHWHTFRVGSSSLPHVRTPRPFRSIACSGPGCVSKKTRADTRCAAGEATAQPSTWPVPGLLDLDSLHPPGASIVAGEYAKSAVLRRADPRHALACSCTRVVTVEER